MKPMFCRERSKSPLVASLREKILSSSSKFINKKNFVLNHLNSNLNKFHNYLSQKFIVLKKGFTLVELSIVLLVLALLVSTLLVGRQIIDRAKVQQIVSELDYYTKNFQMFRDQYDFLPGALDEANCRKYPEFSMQPGTDKTNFPSQCDDPDAMIAQETNKYYTSYKQANFSMVDMVASGMFENRSPGERVRKYFYDDATTETATINVPYCIENIISWDTKEEFTKLLRYLRFKDISTTDVHIYSVSINANVCGGYNCGFGGHRWTNEDTIFMIYSTNCGGTYQTPLISDFLSDMCSKYQGSTYLDNIGYLAYSPRKRAVEIAGASTQIKEKTILATSDGCSYINSKIQRSVSETKTIPGEKRIGYLLKQEEIENQANRSVFDADVWVSYSGGKVVQSMIYGISESAMTIAGDNNTIVFFKFDPNKSEVNADGALKYDTYNLLQKKLGEAGIDKIGNLHINNKSDGEGFNFIYVMR